MTRCVPLTPCHPLFPPRNRVDIKKKLPPLAMQCTQALVTLWATAHCPPTLFPIFLLPI